MSSFDHFNGHSKQASLNESLDRLAALTRALLNHLEQSPSVTMSLLGMGLEGLIGNHFNSDAQCIEMGLDFPSNNGVQCTMLLETFTKKPQQWSFSVNGEEMYAKEMGDRTYNQNSSAWKTGQPPVVVDSSWLPRGRACDANMANIVEKFIAQSIKDMEPLEKRLAHPEFIQNAQLEKSALLGLDLVASLTKAGPKAKAASDSDDAAFSAMMTNLKAKKPGI